MTDAISTSVEGAIASPWVLLALLALAAVDGFFPVVPSESPVVTAGVFAAAEGEPSLPLVVVAAALGAFTGVAVGLGLALTVAGAVELARHARRRPAQVT